LYLTAGLLGFMVMGKPKKKLISLKKKSYKYVKSAWWLADNGGVPATPAAMCNNGIEDC